MNRLLAITLAIALCSCAGEGKKKTVDASEQKLGQRLNKPDTSRRSHFEKYMSNAADARGTAAARFQKQRFRSSNVAGIDNASISMNDQFKTKESFWGKMKFWGKDSTFSEAGKTSNIASKTFDTGSAFKTENAREGSMTFSGADNMFDTGRPALSRSERVGRAPKIIQNIDGASAAQGGYTESEVKSILGRN